MLIDLLDVLDTFGVIACGPRDVWDLPMRVDAMPQVPVMLPSGLEPFIFQ
jgi:hypothetical protein